MSHLRDRLDENVRIAPKDIMRVSVRLLALGVTSLLVLVAAPARSADQPDIERHIKQLDLIRPARAKAAADFSVPLSPNGTFTLSGQREKVILLNFWATWCEPCREEMPSIERLWQRYRNRGLVVLAISLDVKPQLVVDFIARHRLSFPIGLDSKGEVATLYGARALPATFIIDREGALAALALGPRAWDSNSAQTLFESLTSNP
jgi:peroxiredoxin